MKKLIAILLFISLCLVTACSINVGENKLTEQPPEPTKEDLIISDIEKISLPSETKTSLNLESYYIFEATFLNVDWQSSNPDVINERGGITRGATDVTVTLSAHFYSNKGFSYDKTFTVTVLALTVADRLAQALDEIKVDEYLTLSSKLPLQVKDSEINVSWESSSPDIFDENGVRFLPEIATPIHLVVTLSLAGEVLTGEYDVIAFRQEEIDFMNQFNVLNKYLDFNVGERNNLAFDDNNCLVMTGLEGYYLSPIFNTSAFSELTASWSAITNSTTGSVEVQVRLKVGDKWSEYVSYGAWKMSSQNASCSGTTSDGLVKINQDEVTPLGGAKATAFQYRVLFKRAEGEDSPILKCVNVALKIDQGDTEIENGIKQSVVYDVPKLYQREVPEIGGSICSPTTTTMLLKYYGYSFTGLGYNYEHEYVARTAYDHGAGVFGNWSFNVAFMGSMGEFACVWRFAGVNDLINYLSSHGPVGLSVKGNMQGLYTTAGHLLVCKGYKVVDGNYIFICNDPNVVGVEVEYTYETIKNVWRNIAYIIEPNFNI